MKRKTLSKKKSQRGVVNKRRIGKRISNKRRTVKRRNVSKRKKLTKAKYKKSKIKMKSLKKSKIIKGGASEIPRDDKLKDTILQTIALMDDERCKSIYDEYFLNPKHSSDPHNSQYTMDQFLIKIDEMMPHDLEKFKKYLAEQGIIPATHTSRKQLGDFRSLNQPTQGEYVAASSLIDLQSEYSDFDENLLDHFENFLLRLRSRGDSAELFTEPSPEGPSPEGPSMDMSEVSLKNNLNSFTIEPYDSDEDDYEDDCGEDDIEDNSVMVSDDDFQFKYDYLGRFFEYLTVALNHEIPDDEKKLIIQVINMLTKEGNPTSPAEEREPIRCKLCGGYGVRKETCPYNPNNHNKYSRVMAHMDQKTYQEYHKQKTLLKAQEKKKLSRCKKEDVRLEYFSQETGKEESIVGKCIKDSFKRKYECMELLSLEKMGGSKNHYDFWATAKCTDLNTKNDYAIHLMKLATQNDDGTYKFKVEEKGSEDFRKSHKATKQRPWGGFCQVYNMRYQQMGDLGNMLAKAIYDEIFPKYGWGVEKGPPDQSVEQLLPPNVNIDFPKYVKCGATPFEPIDDGMKEVNNFWKDLDKKKKHDDIKKAFEQFVREINRDSNIHLRAEFCHRLQNDLERAFSDKNSYLTNYGCKPIVDDKRVTRVGCPDGFKCCWGCSSDVTSYVITDVKFALKPATDTFGPQILVNLIGHDAKTGREIMFDTHTIRLRNRLCNLSFGFDGGTLGDDERLSLNVHNSPVDYTIFKSAREVAAQQAAAAAGAADSEPSSKRQRKT